MSLKGHDGIMMTGALAALAFHPHGLPRKARPTATALAAASAHDVRGQIDRQLLGLKRRAMHARTREGRIGCEIRALRLEAIGLRYRPTRVEDHLRGLLRAHPQADHLFAGAFGPNLIVDAGEAYLVDAWQNTVELETMKFHGCGTGVTAAAEGNTALGTESTTILNPDNTRATGSLTEASASVFRTVGTLTFDGAGAITEWGLFSQAATGGGVMWSRIVFSAINVASLDSIQFTYDLTVE
jgi:hypothetical protein